MTTTVAEAFIQITQEADSECIQRKRKVDTKMLMAMVFHGELYQEHIQRKVASLPEAPVAMLMRDTLIGVKTTLTIWNV